MTEPSISNGQGKAQWLISRRVRRRKESKVAYRNNPLYSTQSAGPSTYTSPPNQPYSRNNGQNLGFLDFFDGGRPSIGNQGSSPVAHQDGPVDASRVSLSSTSDMLASNLPNSPQDLKSKNDLPHNGGWDLNPSSISASPAGRLVGSDRPWTIRTDPSNSPTSSAGSSPRISHSDSTAPSFPSTPASSLSLDTYSEDDENDEDQIFFPSYDDVGYYGLIEDLEPPASSRSGISSDTASTIISRPDSPEIVEHCEDDSAVHIAPPRHVDYLSHHWREEDIWASWKYVISRGKTYSNSARLENALWRALEKARSNKRTASLVSHNRMNDWDVTWLYGPLVEGHTRSLSPVSDSMTKPGTVATSSETLIDQRPNRKQKRVSAAVFGTSSRLKRSAAVMEAQQLDDHKTADIDAVPILSKRMSLQTSNATLTTPLPGISGIVTLRPKTTKTVRFNEDVRQFTATESTYEEDSDADRYEHSSYDSDSDDGYFMIKRRNPKRGLLPVSRDKNFNLSTSSERQSIPSPDIKTISILPNTTLKVRDDLPEPFQAAAPSEFSYAYDIPVDPSDAWKTTAGNSKLFGRKYEPEKVLEATTGTIKMLDILEDLAFKAHDQSVTTIPANPGSSFSRYAPSRSALVPQATFSKLEDQKEALPSVNYHEPSKNRPTISSKPILLMSLNSESPAFIEPGHAQDGLNKWTTKHFPGLAIDSLPSTSVRRTETAYFGLSDLLASASIAKGPGTGTASEIQTPSSNRDEVGREDAAASIEGWVGRLAIKAPGTSKGSGSVEAVGLAELLDETRLPPRYENRENINLPEIMADSEDEGSKVEKDFAKPKCTEPPDLRRTLFEQETIDLEDVFGQPGPFNMEEVFGKSQDRFHKFRERTSSRSDVEVETLLSPQPTSNADCNDDSDTDCQQREFQNSSEVTMTNDMIDDMTGSMDGEESTTESYSSESETGSNNSAYLGMCKAERGGHSLPKIIEPVLDPMREALIDRIMEDFWVLFDQEWDTGYVQEAAGVSPSSASGSNSGSTASTNSMTLSPSQRKRQREEEDPSEERNGRNPRYPRSCVGPSTGCDESTRFACPFRKHDSRKYSVYSHRVCALSHWETIARVKEHLYRCHQRPVHCKRCWKIFKTQEQLDSHLTVFDADICGLQAGCSPEGITAEHERRLRSRKKTSPDQTDEDRWKDIYRLLFPNEEIPSPYFETLQEETPMSPDSRDLADYEAYIRAELPRLVRFNIEEVVRRDMQPLEASLIGSLVGIIRDCQDRVFRSYRETQRRRDEVELPARINSEVSAALEGIDSADNSLHANPLDQYLRPSRFVGDIFQPPPAQNVNSEFQMPAMGESQGGVLGPSSDLVNSDSGYASEQVQVCDCPGPCNCVGTSTIPHDRSQDLSNNFNLQELGYENMLSNGWNSTPSWTELNSMENDFDWVNDA